ncbi:MAG TPA: hypothetical protein VNW90_24015 [Acetobacteraceae bacterium]|jgi:hypothetical protein|nr:hypothetical protein [Acetobacteraceae bacterium]
MSATEATADPKPSRAGRLLGLVRQFIDYGRQLAATLRINPPPFSISDIALILARITRGLLRAEALEARVIRDTARLDAEPAPPRAPPHRLSPPARAANAASREAPVPGPDAGISLRTAEQIAAEVRRRPIGAVIADICRDLGIMPSHPLWRDLSELIIRYGGNLANLVKDILDRAFPRPAASGPPAWPAVSPQSPAPSGAGPPP